ncbi:PepSY domain-containing protein [Rhodobacteraceae bacterium CCMM004]|nr:PepSY domain-containing protein [Rhodobacteraceae bacterium CCMM004]
MTFRTTLAPVLLAALIPVGAIAAVTQGTALPVDLDEMRAALATEGYTVTEIEVEDGEIEVEALFDGTEVELTLAADGTVLGVETEEEDDDD